jgi:hypothetical protein
MASDDYPEMEPIGSTSRSATIRPTSIDKPRKLTPKLKRYASAIADAFIDVSTLLAMYGVKAQREAWILDATIIADNASAMSEAWAIALADNPAFARYMDAAANASPWLRVARVTAPVVVAMVRNHAAYAELEAKAEADDPTSDA